MGLLSKKVTVGYKYFLGLHAILCHGPVDKVTRIDVDKRTAWSGTSTGGTVSVYAPTLFGGDSSEGGVSGDVDIAMGGPAQSVNGYLSSKLGADIPAYRGVVGAILRQCYMGNNQYLKPWAFWASRIHVRSGGVTQWYDAKAAIGDDMNPAHIIRELLTDQTWGMGYADGDIDDASFQAAADTLHGEGFGLSFIWERSQSIEDIVQSVMEHIDAVLYVSRDTGKFCLKLARADYDPNTIQVLGEDDIVSITDFRRPALGDLINQVTVKFWDYASGNDNSVTVQDLALANQQRTTIGTTTTYAGVVTPALATKIASRDLKAVSSPLASATLECGRSAALLNVGDVFKLVWPRLGLSSMIMRVTGMELGELDNNTVKIDAVEDVFSFGASTYAPPPPSGWVAPTSTAVVALDARLINLPAPLSASPYQPTLLVARNGGQHISFDVYVDQNGGTDAFASTIEESTDWNPVALLNGAISADLNGPPHYSGAITIDNLVDIDGAAVVAAAAASVSTDEATANIILVDDELMWWTAATDNGNGSVTMTVQRGAFGTIPANHADNARVWFIARGGVAINGDNIDPPAIGASIRARVVTNAIGGPLPLASAPNIPPSADYSVIRSLVYAPGNLTVGGNLAIDANWTKTPGRLRLAFIPRSDEQPLNIKQDDSASYVDSAMTYTAEVRRVDNNAVVATRANVPASATGINIDGYIPQTTPGVPDELDYTLTLKSSKAGQSSQVYSVHAFEVFGFGIDFGGDFGGQDTGGQNYGVWRSQGAAPYAPEPVPGINTQRSVTFSFSGTSATTETLDAYLMLSGGEIGSAYVSVTISGSTPLALATDLSDELDSALSAGGFATSVYPYVEIIRADSSVTVSSYYFSLSAFAGNRVGMTASVLAQQAKASTGTNIKQRAFVDFWDAQYSQSAQQVVDVLAPDTDANYTLDAWITARVIGLTHEARLALSSAQDGRPVASRDFSFSFRGSSSYRGTAIASLVAAMQADAEFSQFSQSAHGMNTEPAGNDNGNNVAMTRTAVTLLAADSYRLDFSGPNGTQSTPAVANGHWPLIKQIVGADVRQSLAQVIKVSASKANPSGENFTVGQQFILTLNGTDVIYTATSGDVSLEGASSTYRDPVLEYWAANLPSGFSGSLERYPSRDVTRSDGRTFFYSGLYIKRTAVNTPFTYSVTASHGSRLTVTTI